MIEELTAQDPFVRRAAAEALGAHPSLANVKPLLTLRQSVSGDDSHLLHVVRMALRDQLKTAEIWPRLETLDLSARDRRDLADVALGVPSPQAAEFLLKQIRLKPESQDVLLRQIHHVARHGGGGSAARLVAIARADHRSPADRLALFRAIQQGMQERGESLDAEVRKDAADLCRELLAAGHADQIGAGIEAAREFQLAELIPDLRRVATSGPADSRRGQAMQAIAAIDPASGLTLLRELLKASATPIEVRESAAITLANLERPEAQAAVLEVLPTAPQRLESTMAAALARRKAGAEALLKAIEAGKGSARLLQERPIVIGLENAEIDHLSERIAAVLKGLPPADQKLRELLQNRRAEFLRSANDPARGASVFEKNCAICHQLQGKGAKVGPQLDGIGSRGLERLLEDVLDPNRNVDQSFRVTNLALQNGQIVSGLLLREEGEILIVADAQGKEIRIPKATVEERSTAQLSPMPANLSAQIPEPEFQDLMAYLLSRREDVKPAPARTK